MDSRTTVSLLLLLLLGLCSAHDDNDHTAEEDTPVSGSDEDIYETILRMNNASSDFLLDGDVMIPKTRNARKCLSKQFSCVWPKSAAGFVELPFTLSEKYDYSERREILNALKELESKTCIRPVPRSYQRAYLSIQPRSGCSSLVGYMGDKQVLSLMRFGCIQRGIILHEVLHSLGFYHEQNRSDRDQYIRINWENIPRYFTINFRKMDTNNLNTPYDYSSVMHYGRYAFGENKAETITPLGDPSTSIGQRKGPSDIDILRINKLYKCYNYMG